MSGLAQFPMSYLVYRRPLSVRPAKSDIKFATRDRNFSSNVSEKF